MPELMRYDITVHVAYEVRANGEFLFSGAAPGEATATNEREKDHSPIRDAVEEAITQAGIRVSAAVEGSEKAHRRERGEAY